MRIVVTGASGFIGTPLIRDLLGAGHDVTALTRDVAGAVRVLPARCRILRWDPLAPDGAALRGANAVVHFAGAGVADRRWTAARKREIRDSRVVVTRALVDALARLAPDERPRVLLSASAIGWYGDRADEWLDEASGPGAGFLAEVCREWERAVERARGLDVRTVALRIGVVLGRGGGALETLLPLFRLDLGGRVGSGRQWFSWVHLDDVVGLTRHILEHPGAAGPINAVAPAPVTNREFTAALGRAMHRPAILPAPAAALRVAFGEMANVMLASQRVLPQRARALGYAFRYPTLPEALAALCASPDRELLVEQAFARPPEAIFPFFADPANLERITPEFLRFRVLQASTPTIAEGTVIDYALRLHGIPVRWQSRIEAWQPNRSFVDMQTRGPYRRWHHTHEFEAHDGGTVMRDRVRYRLPFGCLGDLIAGRLVRRDLRAIFDFRRARIAELLPDGNPTPD